MEISKPKTTIRNFYGESSVNKTVKQYRDMSEKEKMLLLLKQLIKESTKSFSVAVILAKDLIKEQDKILH